MANSTKLRRGAPVRIADIGRINTFVADVALPAGLANICRTNGQAAKRENPLSLVVSEFRRDLISIEGEVAKMNK